MLELAGIAKSLNLCARIVQDACVSDKLVCIPFDFNLEFRGRTQIAAGSSTVLGIGPGKIWMSMASRL